VFQDRVAFDALERIAGEGESLGIGNHIDAWKPEKINVDVTLNEGSGAANIEIPPAQRRVNVLEGIHDEKVRRFQEPVEAMPPAAGGAAFVQPLDIVTLHPMGQYNSAGIESLTIESLTINLNVASPRRSLPNPAHGPAQKFFPFAS
jgi:hypothetical protein